MNATSNTDRYPGARSFTDTEHDRLLFFGREQEISAFLYQALSVHLLILYGKSGLGKTSLLQAGVFPRLREHNFLPLPVRLNRPELSLMTVFADEINKTCSALGIDYTPGETAGLWEFFKTAVFWRGDSLQTPALALDQFEEIFTLQSADNRRWLARELGDLIGGRLPQRVRERLQRGEKLPYSSEKPPAVKIILSLREDYLGALQELTAEAPQILNDRFRLTPLNRAQARLAVVKPAQLQAAEFSTQPFAYDDSAVEEMLTFLGGKSGEIEPFQLQVLCHQVERKVQQEQVKGKQDIRVDRAYLGGRKAMEKILQNFYLDAIKRLSKRRLRNRARRLCEEGLLSPEGHRVSLVENNIKTMYKLRPPALQTLVDARLLRKEERLESYYYELSHDSLTRPIVNSRRWRMPRGLKIGLGVAGLVLLISGSGFYWIWDTQLREHVEYYNTFVKRWGKPVGIGHLTSEQVKHRAVSLKFVRHGRHQPVERVVAVNDQGECTPQNTVGTYFKNPLAPIEPLRECQWEFVYDSRGQVVYEKAYNKLEQMVQGFIYSPSEENEQKHGHYVGSDGFPRPQLNSSAEFVEFRYSPQGDETSVFYFDRYHRRQPNSVGAFGSKQEFYPNGLKKQQTSLDSKDQPMNDKDGNATEKLAYDKLGNLVESTALDVNGKPVITKTGRHRFTAKYDDYGNVTEGNFYDTADQPTLVEGNFHKITIKYDKHGNRVESAFFDTTGRPTFALLSGAEQFTIAGQSTSFKLIFHKVIQKYDEHGNLIEGAFFDTAGRPILLQTGVHKSRLKYDERGSPVEQTFFDTNDQPTLYSNGFHKVTTKFDESGHLVEMAFFDTANQPTLLKKVGVHKINTEYDEHGNPVQQSYFDIAGQPALHKDGYHLFKAQYDERHNRIEESYFDTAGKPTLHKNGYHRSTNKYDERGNLIEWAYFDTAGQPTLSKDGYHRFKAQYDERGNQTERAFFDATGQPILVDNNFHRAATKYDERGNLLEEAYFDTTGKAILGKDGYHLFKAKYDERGNQIEGACFDTADKAILSKDGYHLFKAKYDEHGNQIEWAYFDTAGKPTLHKNGYHQSTAKYDEHGNQIEWAYFDTAGQPILYKDGYHLVKAQYDEHGNRIEWAYFDTVGKPISANYSFHKGLAKYDKYGNEIERKRFDTAGQPTLNKDGYHRSITKYDQYANEIEWAYFDVNGKPTLNQADGIQRKTARYDERGNRIEEAYYGMNGEPVASKEGFSKHLWRYYLNGQKAEEIVIGLDGSKGFTKQITRYDEAGREIYQGFFDDQDKPAHTNDKFATPFGYSEKISQYGPAGELFIENFSGFEPYWGYTKMLIIFDGNGNSINSSYFDSNDQPVEAEVVATTILPDSPAEKIGIQSGDVFIDYDGRPITDFVSFIAQNQVEPADGPAKEMHVRRNEKILTFSIPPGKLGVGLQGRGISH